MPNFDVILIPTDFSEDAEAALARAIPMARSFGSRIHLLHVHHAPGYASSAWSVPLDFVDQIRRDGEERLQALRDKMAGEGLEVSSEVRDGIPSETIVAVAEELPADVIVMGTRGRTGLGHVLLGSVAERTLRYAPCPVMTVKASAEAGA